MKYNITENELFALTLLRQVLKHVNPDATDWHFKTWAIDAEEMHYKLCKLLDVPTENAPCSYYKD